MSEMPRVGSKIALFQINVVGERGQNLQEFNHVFMGIPKALKSFKPAFKNIGEDFRERMKGRFEKEGAYEEMAKWGALKPAYAKIKAIRHPGCPILQLTNAWLKKSLSVKDFLCEKGRHIEEISAKEMSIGTSIPYAIYHQTGTKKMIARQPLRFSEEHKKKVVQIMHEFIHDAVEKQLNKNKR